jgi:hypothetical protein
MVTLACDMAMVMEIDLHMMMEWAMMLPGFNELLIDEKV